MRGLASSYGSQISYFENGIGLFVLTTTLELYLLIYPTGKTHVVQMNSVHICAGKVHFVVVWLLAIILLLSTGISYRVLAKRLDMITDKAIKLPVPLNKFPMKIGNWTGQALAIRDSVKKYMETHFADDYISRRYINTETGVWADVYIVYCSSQPGGILGHRPRICYPNQGWIHEGTESSEITSKSGRQFNCLFHRFYKPAPLHDRTIAMNYYILNGTITANEKDFSGFWGRRPNISGNPARYVAQVQVSSVSEKSIRMIIKDITDVILDYLPDETGRVRASGLNYELNDDLE